MPRKARFAGAAFAMATGLLLLRPGWGGQARSGGPPPEAKEAAKPQEPPAISVYDAGVVRFSASPPTAVEAGVQCDANGNIYAVYTASLQSYIQSPERGLGNLPLTRISPGSETTTEFQVPAPQGYPHSYERGFYVTPRGDVYGLVEAYSHSSDYDGPNWPDSFLVKYKDDGSVDSLTKLELPQSVHFTPSRLAVFGDGTFLVTGLEVSGPRHIPAGVLTALFDRAGTYAGPLKLSDDIRPEALDRGAVARAGAAPGDEPGNGVDSQGKGDKEGVPWPAEVSGSLMAGSPDGSVYLIRPTSPARVYVISPGGTVARQFRIGPPETGMIPIQASFGAQGELLVEFSEPPTSDSAQRPWVIALVDPETGKLVQVVAGPANAGILGCSSPQDEFMFLRTSKDGHLEVAKFVSR